MSSLERGQKIGRIPAWVREQTWTGSPSSYTDASKPQGWWTDNRTGAAPLASLGHSTGDPLSKETWEACVSLPGYGAD